LEDGGFSCAVRRRHLACASLEHAPSGHVRDFDLSPAPRPVERLIREFVPVITRQAVVDLFERKAPWESIRSWRKGHRATPLWALDLLERKALERLAEIQSQINLARRQTKERPGLKAGALNLAKWKARR
jgi:hypothetical protein